MTAPIVAHSNPREPDMLTVSQDDRSQEYRDFLKYVAETSGVISYQQLVVLYPAICQAAMTWLLDKKQSVDFGFARFHPCPHRANWKQIMVSLFPSMGTALLGKPRAVKEAILTSTGFLTKLLSGELLAVGSERYVVWGIETELKRSWWRAMYRMEMYKFSQLGSTGYATHTAKQIVRLKQRLVNAYLSFLRQVSYPVARIVHSRVYRRGYIAPYVPKGKVRPVALGADLPTDYVVTRDPERIVTPSLLDLASTDADVPEVPDIQQESKNLRITRDDFAGR